MAQNNTRKGTIVVAGDVTIDWNIVKQQGRGSKVNDLHQARARAYQQRGGAFLLADIIQGLAKYSSKSFNYHIFQIAPPTETILPSDNRFHHTYSLWSLFQEGEQLVWRMVENLGFDQRPGKDPTFEDWNQVKDDPIQADLILLNDQGLGFLDAPNLWPQALSSGKGKPWVVLKMTHPFIHSALWEHLLGNHHDRLIVVTTAQALRESETQISQGLSWERTAQDVTWELVYNPKVNNLSRCAAVVVSFDTAGAILLSQLEKRESQSNHGTSHPSYQLFFDPLVIEGLWKQGHPGRMFGYTTCLATGIANQLIQNLNQPTIQEGIQAGLTAMRKLHRDGFQLQEIERGTQLTFPVESIVDVLKDPPSTFSLVNIQGPFEYLRSPANEGEQNEDWWTILHDQHYDHLDLLAEEIVREGTDIVLKDVPQGRFGHLLTVDRREIESYRSIYAFAEDLNEKQSIKPLSIAVFGAPGSGKSFGVTQVAKSLAPGKVEKLEFNLSQFESPHELLDAMHLIRDVNLSGKIPLVFWDEFDTPLAGKPLGWLRYFLAPMQDGEFRQGQIIHPIGQAIFVFAGGTSHRMQDFGKGLSEKELREAKVPDFLSRLKGYVNVLGPNPLEGESTLNGNIRDFYFIIRRAIILRTILKINVPKLFQKNVLQIDQGVLRAFLFISKYKHGIRSIESIITMSQLAGKKSYQRSALPSEEQLDLHVDGHEFLALVHEVELTGALLEELAEANHRLFCQDLEKKGYQPGPKTDEESKTHRSLKPYQELSEEEKNRNRNAVRDIPQILASIGYIMIPVRSDAPPFQFSEDSDELEKLTRWEYERQERLKETGGWRLDVRKVVPTTSLPWEKMPEAQKKSYRDLIRLIPHILGQAGYTIVGLSEGRKQNEE